MLNELQTKAHYGGIGGSMAASILGLNPYQSNVDAYLMLTNLDYRKKQNEDINNKLQVMVGNALEPIVVKHAEEINGWLISRPDQTFVDKECDFLVGHIDGIIDGKEELLEIKTRGYFASKGYGEEGTDQILDSDYIQVMHYLMITGFKAAHLAAFMLGSGEIKYFYIERDDGVISMIREKLVKFWNENVLPRVPPQPLTVEDAQKIWPRSSANSITASDDAMIAVKKYMEAKEMEKEALKIQEENKLILASCLQDFDTLLDASGKPILTYKTQSASRVDSQTLKTLYPEVYSKCLKSSEFRVMRIK